MFFFFFFEKYTFLFKYIIFTSKTVKSSRFIYIYYILLLIIIDYNRYILKLSLNKFVLLRALNMYDKSKD